jgi:hypothetical protein
MTNVLIKAGKYRGEDVVNTEFELVKDYTEGKKGGFITVDGNKHFGRDKVRVNVGSREDFVITNGDGAVPEAEVKETDEEVMDRIEKRFKILDTMTIAAISGDIRSLIVSGPPGVGKSFGVERELERTETFRALSGNTRGTKYEVIKGSASAIALYMTLWKFSDPNCVLVFDDCDSILLDDVCLNLLKGALDSGKKRRISWLAESSTLRREDIPTSFDFKGSVIFITNLKFDNFRGKLADHLAALQSRCHYLDLTLDTMRDKILRIRQIARTGQLFGEQGIGEVGQAEIINFVDDNKSMLREVSLRMAVKIAELFTAFPEDWKDMARTTCMKRKVV